MWLQGIALVFGYVLIRLVCNIVDRYRRVKRWQKAVSHLPGEKPNLLWGFTKELERNLERRLDYVQDLFENEAKGTSGNITLPGALFLPEGVVVTIDPATVEHILRTKHDIWLKHWKDVPPKHMFWHMMGDGIFAVNHGPHIADKGNGWRIQRKIAAQPFTQYNFREYFAHTFVQTANTLVDCLKEKVDAATARGEKEVKIDIQEYFFKYTMDTFGIMGFGEDFGTLRGADNTFATSFDEAHACILPFDQREMPLICLAQMFGWPISKWSLTWAEYLPYWRKYNKHYKAMNAWIYPLIEKRRKDPELMEKNDLLSLFLKATMEEENTDTSDKFLRDIILNLIIAGRDTTACTLTWMVHCLTTYEGIADKLIEEIDTNLGETAPTFENIKQLKYLHGCVMETLRLHPPVPIDPKVAAQDDVLPDGTFIPEKTILWYFPWGMGRNPKIWDEPLSFKPERWNDAKPTQYEFPVFQAGPRFCLGKDMAVLEAKFAITVLLQHFRFRADPTAKVTYSQMITMGVKGSLPVYLRDSVDCK